LQFITRKSCQGYYIIISAHSFLADAVCWRKKQPRNKKSKHDSLKNGTWGLVGFVKPSESCDIIVEEVPKLVSADKRKNKKENNKSQLAEGKLITDDVPY
jgi:hypothetical protein